MDDTDRLTTAVRFAKTSAGTDPTGSIVCHLSISRRGAANTTYLIPSVSVTN